MQNAQTPGQQAQRGTSAAGGGPSGSLGKDAHSNRVDVINTKGGRILCVADVRGAISTLNTLAAEHSAVAIIHSGDFGFYEPSSLPSISDRTLRHLVQYSSLIPPAFRSQLLAPSTTPQAMRELLASPPKGAGSSASFFGLSEFPKLLTGELKLNVPVYTVWGACEDVAIVEKIRLAAPSLLTVPSDPSQAPPATSQQQLPTTTSGYSIPNLTVLDEATTRVLLIGGVRLRLFGLGGAVVGHKLFDTGTGSATIAGGGGTMWTTILQVGEIVDTAQKVYDPTETRLLVSHASPGREGLLTQLCLVLKADLTLSAGLHFRYGVSYNEFSVQHDPEAFKGKLEFAKKSFNDVWDTVKNQVDGVIDENQRRLLENALAVANRVPAAAPANGGPAVEETAWKNCWNWNLPDAAFGSLVLDVRDGRVGSEMKSQGFNFAYRQNNARPTSGASVPASRPTTAAASTPPPPSSSPAPPGGAPNSSAPTSTSTFSNSQRPAHLSYPNNLGPNRGPNNNQHHTRAPSGPSGPGQGGFNQNPNNQTQPRGPPSGPGRGGWGQTAAGIASASSDSEKKPSPPAAAPSKDSPAGSPKPAAAEPPTAAAATSTDSPSPAPPASAPSPSPKPEGSAPHSNGGGPSVGRQNSNRHLRQQRSGSKDDVSSPGGHESSGGENARSPPGTSSGADNARGKSRDASASRGRGRGRGGGRGGSGEFPRGGGRGARGRGDSDGPATGGGAAESSSSPATTTTTTPAPSTKAGANGGGW
ncbi:hypothetical protein RQP46_009277 [Phenoliferia psychrophenolica]